VRAVERRRPPEAVDVEDFLRDRDLGVLGDLLADELHREERREVVRPDGLPGAGVEHRLGRRGHVGADVVPAPRQLRLVEEELRLGRSGGAGLLHGLSIERVLSTCIQQCPDRLLARTASSGSPNSPSQPHLTGAARCSGARSVGAAALVVQRFARLVRNSREVLG
jgi:hypothetical protein